MARQNVLFIAFVVAALVPVATFAKEIIVGDAAGWVVKFDYVSWAKKQDFHVGDTLVFKYPQGAQTVIKVDENSYKNCIIPQESRGNPVLGSGKDVISLESLGKKWFVCGIPQHCEKGGQKLEVDVKAAAASPAKTTASPNAAPVPSATKSHKKTAKSPATPSPARSATKSDNKTSTSSPAAPSPVHSATKSDNKIPISSPAAPAPAHSTTKSDNKTATSPAVATPSNDDSSSGAPAPAPGSSANGLNGYQLPVAIMGAIAALAIF
ncbi:blue copper protein 1b-like [Cornus florida]|uniref:blue copper protein 1b-like n=1 Tax=Cornus florida TaxID=4283 RepID=UPI0028A2B2A5|nr:blue copper protein 1b-like [Cornus florida]